MLSRSGRMSGVGMVEDLAQKWQKVSYRNFGKSDTEEAEGRA